MRLCCVLLWLNKREALRWRHNGRDCVSNHQPHDCLLNHLFRRRSKKTSNLRVTGLCAGNSPGTGEFPAEIASYAENVSISWRHHEWETKREEERDRERESERDKQRRTEKQTDIMTDWIEIMVKAEFSIKPISVNLLRQVCIRCNGWPVQYISLDLVNIYKPCS